MKPTWSSVARKARRRSPLKEPPLRVPGQSLNSEIGRVIDDASLFWVLIPVLLWLFAAYEWLTSAAGLGRSPGAFVVAALVMSVVSAFRIRQVRANLEDLRLGLSGERFVGQMLDELRVDGARILHDIQGDHFNVDHLVISPRGIYCVETKTHSKSHADAKIDYDGQRVLVDGYAPDRDPIRQVTASARWLEDQIAASTGRRFPVRPVVVYPNWWVQALPGARASLVWVLEPKALIKWIENATVTVVDSDVALVSYHVGRMIRAGEKEEFGL